MESVHNLLKENNLNSNADNYTLDLLGDNFELYEMSYADLINDGVIITSNTGVKKTNPAYNLFCKCSSIILHILADFGISTKSRKQIMRLEAEADDKNSPLLNLLSDDVDDDK